LILKVEDPDGAEFCSKLLGHVYGYEWTHSVSFSHTSGLHPSTTSGMSAQEHYANYPLVHPDEIRFLPLADFEHGFHGFGIVPGSTGTHRWRFHLTPKWLAKHVVRSDEHIASYESCRRTGSEQRLKELTQDEVERLGLRFEEDKSKSGLGGAIRNVIREGQTQGQTQ